MFKEAVERKHKTEKGILDNLGFLGKQEGIGINDKSKIRRLACSVCPFLLNLTLPYFCFCFFSGI